MAQRPPPAQDAARGGQHQVLDQQLAHQPHAAGAQRQPDAHFAAPRQGSGEHDGGDVRARDQQQHADRRADGLRGRAIVLDEGLAQRPHEGSDHVVFVVRLPDRLVRALQVGVGCAAVTPGFSRPMQVPE